MFALNINSDNRILSVCKVLPKGIYTNMIIVNSLPKGKATDYLYVDGEFIYDPKPKTELPKMEFKNGRFVIKKDESATPAPTLDERVAALEQTVNTTVSEYTTALQELGVET